jgi:hypothetical protein
MASAEWFEVGSGSCYPLRAALVSEPRAIVRSSRSGQG